MLICTINKNLRLEIYLNFSIINLSNKLPHNPRVSLQRYNLEKNITRHMRIQTRGQILFACEFARAKRRNKYENTYYARAQWENAEKREETRMNERTKGEALSPDCFPS